MTGMELVMYHTIVRKHIDENFTNGTASKFDKSLNKLINDLTEEYVVDHEGEKVDKAELLANIVTTRLDFISAAVLAKKAFKGKNPSVLAAMLRETADILESK